MPRKRIKPVGRRGIRLEDPGPNTNIQILSLVDYLLHGDHCFAKMLDDSVGFENTEEEQITWKLNRNLLLSMMTADPSESDFHYLAGNRPWAWWKYDSDAREAIWTDWRRFGYDWQLWQYKHLKKHGLLFTEEEENVRRLCERILSDSRYGIHDPHLQERERKRRIEARKPFVLN